MLTPEQAKEIDGLAVESIEKCIRVWDEHGDKMRAQKTIVLLDESRRHQLKTAAETKPSRIPGHPYVSGNSEKVGSFIALMADMRDSSKHLLMARGKYEGIFRIYAETSALLPCLTKTLNYQSGETTEYLGDGILGLFEVKDDDKGDLNSKIYKAHEAASNCVGETRIIVNEMLKSYFNFPPIDLGVGLSYSKCIVGLIGIEGKRDPKVFGRCVYRASKLCKGTNEIWVDDWLQDAWPTAKDGKLRFFSRKISGDFPAYAIG